MGEADRDHSENRHITASPTEVVPRPFRGADDDLRGASVQRVYQYVTPLDLSFPLFCPCRRNRKTALPSNFEQPEIEEGDIPHKTP